MSAKDLLEGGLKTVESFLNLSKSSSDASDLVELQSAALSFKYKSDAAVSGGFKSVASTDRDIISSVDGSTPGQITKKLGLVQLDPSASTQDLVKVVEEADKTDLTAIAGDARLAADGFLDIAIGAPFPEALAQVIKDTTDINSSGIKDIVNSNVSSELFKDNILDTVLGDVLQNTGLSISNVSNNAINAQLKSFNNILNKVSFGFDDLIGNLVEESFRSTENTLGKVAIKNNVVSNVSPEDITRIVNLKKEGNILEGVKILKKYSDRPDAELENSIRQIDNRASKALEPKAAAIDIPTKRTDDYVNVWREADTNPKSKIFDSIVDYAEISTEIANLKRDVTQIVIEAWNVFASDGKGKVEEYHQVFVDEYNQGLEPHLFVDQSGVVHRGRPLEIKGTGIYYDGLPDHSERTILIALEQLEWNASAAQIKTMRKLLQAIYEVKPGIQALALYDILSTTEAPWWDVQNTVKVWYGKENVKGYNPRKSLPLTQKQIIDGVGN